MYPGRSEEQKKRLACAIGDDVIAATGCGEESVSVTVEEVAPNEWKERVYKPETVNYRGTLYKPGTRCDESMHHGALARNTAGAT